MARATPRLAAQERSYKAPEAVRMMAFIVICALLVSTVRPEGHSAAPPACALTNLFCSRPLPYVCLDTVNYIYE